jgi:DNA repair exonuclease SbcCD ATPase subunit
MTTITTTTSNDKEVSPAATNAKRRAASTALDKDSRELIRMIKKAAELYQSAGGVVDFKEILEWEEEEFAKLDTVQEIEQGAEEADEFDRLIMIANEKIKAVRLKLNELQRSMSSDDDHSRINEQVEQQNHLKIMIRSIRDKELEQMKQLKEQQKVVASSVFRFVKSKRSDDQKLGEYEELINNLEKVLSDLNEAIDRPVVEDDNAEEDTELLLDNHLISEKEAQSDKYKNVQKYTLNIEKVMDRIRETNRRIDDQIRAVADQMIELGHQQQDHLDMALENLENLKNVKDRVERNTDRLEVMIEEVKEAQEATKSQMKTMVFMVCCFFCVLVLFVSCFMIFAAYNIAKNQVDAVGGVL